MYNILESRFPVVYPNNNNATYSSIMNYSDDLKSPLQRWYRYKEGFSIELINTLINKYNKNKNGTIIDPFMGSGTTLIAANMNGLRALGFEVNPFSYFLSKCKLNNYPQHCIEELKSASSKITSTCVDKDIAYSLPKLSIAHKVFDKPIESYLLSIKVMIDNYPFIYRETKDLMMLGWLSCIEELSNYRKAGNGLKKKKYVKPKVLSKQNAKEMLQARYDIMIEDISNVNIPFDVQLYNQSSINMGHLIPDETISGVIYSPPYANCFDYTEIYKLELWFGGFVNEYEDLKHLRKESIRSHLNGNLDITDNIITTKTLLGLLDKLNTKQLWDKKLPTMLQLYFSDMFEIINYTYKLLEKNGFCCIAVGNSSYGNVVFPTDLLFAEYASSIGFEVDVIEVDRYLITSSQQYKSTINDKKYLRESLVCLIKK